MVTRVDDHDRLWPIQFWPIRFWPPCFADQFSNPFLANPFLANLCCVCCVCCVVCVVCVWCVCVCCGVVFKIFVGVSKFGCSLRTPPHGLPQNFALFFTLPPRLQGCRGFTRQPENSKSAHLIAPGASNHQKTTRRHPERDKKSEMWQERKKKARIFGPPTLQGPKLWNPTWVWAPPFGAMTHTRSRNGVARIGQNWIGQHWICQNWIAKIGLFRLYSGCCFFFPVGLHDLVFPEVCALFGQFLPCQIAHVLLVVEPRSPRNYLPRIQVFSCLLEFLWFFRVSTTSTPLSIHQ